MRLTQSGLFRARRRPAAHGFHPDGSHPALPAAATRAPLLLGLLLLTGCKVGPDFLSPAAPTATGYTPEALPVSTSAARVHGGEAQHFVRNLDIPGEWWQLFHSRPLDRLVAQALRANPDIDAAQAALREAQENLYAGQGSLFPSIGANVQAERQALAGVALGQPGRNFTLNLTTAQLSVSYAPDVFGGTRRQIESLAAQAEYQAFQLEATYLTLTSNVVAEAVNEASLRGQIAATEQAIKVEQQSLDLVQRQFSVGAAAKASVLSQQATLAQTRANLPLLEKQLAQSRNRLARLIGQDPSQTVGARFDLSSLELPRELPVSLPSNLVRQRPDVRAAEAQLHTASANVGVAIANQLPQFSITAGFGGEAGGFAGLFQPGSLIWSMVGSVSQKLFDAGTLAHKKRAAIAALDQAAAQYRSTVLTALQNVADALRALQSDADAVRAQTEAERAAFASLQLARQQFQLGATDYLTLLNADRTWEQARIGLVQAEANRFADTAALFQALGGGWWHRSDLPRPPRRDLLTPPLVSALKH